MLLVFVINEIKIVDKRERLGIIIALDRVTAELAEKIELVDRFDALLSERASAIALASIFISRSVEKLFIRNSLSSLISSIGSSFSMLNEELPLPKSSIQHLKPFLRRSDITSRSISKSSYAKLSVNSSVITPSPMP